jgi:hypothetical protein
LGHSEAEAGAIKPVPNGSDYDWHEEEVEEPEPIFASATDDRPEGGTDDDNLENALRRD